LLTPPFETFWWTHPSKSAKKRVPSRHSISRRRNARRASGGSANRRCALGATPSNARFPRSAVFFAPRHFPKPCKPEVAAAAKMACRIIFLRQHTPVTDTVFWDPRSFYCFPYARKMRAGACSPKRTKWVVAALAFHFPSCWIVATKFSIFILLNVFSILGNFMPVMKELPVCGKKPRDRSI